MGNEKKTPQINKDNFVTRCTKLYDYWEKDENLSKLNAFAFIMGTDDDSGAYSKTLTLHTWLFSCTIADTMIVFTKEKMYFLGSAKKIHYFDPVVSSEYNGKVPPMITILRDKNDKDKANMGTLCAALKKAGDKYGYFDKDRKKFDTDFAKAWIASTMSSDVNEKFSDVSTEFAKLFSVKDEKEQGFLKNSALATVNSWAHFRKKVIEIIDHEKKVKHSKLANEMDDDFLTVQVQGSLVDKGILDMCYSPIIQSGGKYELKYSAVSDDRILHFGTIVSSIGLRFNSYCSNLTRTLLVDPSKELEATYEHTLKGQAAIIEALKPGKRICDAYKAGIAYFTENCPKLVENLVKTNFGFLIGVEFREPCFLINEKCVEIVRADMVFTVYVALQNIKNRSASEEAGKNVAIMVGDTVLVTEEGSNEILTEKARSRAKSTIIRINAEANEAASRENVRPSNGGESLGRGKRSVVLQDQTRNKTTNEEKRKEKQRELMVKLNEAAKERILNKATKQDTIREKKSTVSYKKPSRFPSNDEINSQQIFIDKDNYTVILPLYGIPVPFHVSVIKNCSQSIQGDHTYLRINFSFPGSQVGVKEASNNVNPLLTYLKEITYRSSNLKEPGEINAPSSNLENSFRFIKEMQKKFKNKEAEELEAEGTIKQDKLIISNSKNNPKLKDLFVRPVIAAKKVTGYLEAHVNGFRYTSVKGEKIDVLYNNIKHSFFQPCDGEMIILLHFNLKNPVLWGKKKYSDIQFYTEVGELTTDLGKYHHMQERDDRRSEDMEREMRKRLNQAFQTFVDRVIKASNDEIDFDSPFSQLGFHGVPYRSSVVIKPTSSCIVSLTEWPTLVVTLSEIELVHFERVSFQLKNFDLVIIFKDYTKPVQTITQIPMNQLDGVKEWLNSCDIRYTEGIQSLRFSKILATVLSDPIGFFNDGGWGFLADDDENTVQEDNSDSDESEFAGSEAESDAEDGSEDDFEESGDESDDGSDDEGSLSSGQSSGKDWSDLEEEAQDFDRQKTRQTDEEDNTRKRKLGNGSSSGNNAKRRRH
uniref:FACT complex subunit n=1 Tax=Rhabditophanes sp. KR3021 TaxID=114890 RepID=A0AC35UB63_9BILA